MRCFFATGELASYAFLPSHLPCRFCNACFSRDSDKQNGLGYFVEGAVYQKTSPGFWCD